MTKTMDKKTSKNKELEKSQRNLEKAKNKYQAAEQDIQNYYASQNLPVLSKTIKIKSEQHQKSLEHGYQLVDKKGHTAIVEYSANEGAHCWLTWSPESPETATKALIDKYFKETEIPQHTDKNTREKLEKRKEETTKWISCGLKIYQGLVIHPWILSAINNPQGSFYFYPDAEEKTLEEITEKDKDGNIYIYVSSGG